MANIKIQKINKLTSLESAEMVDLKAESEKGNPEAITAFKSLRSGGCCGWTPQTLD
jgi:hypothetical protein